MESADPFDLNRFITAQADVFATVLAELQAGRKESHWMWFVVPQLRGLGSSPMSRFYGIGTLDEARAYLSHPLLGDRLVVCTRTVLAIRGRSLVAIFGTPDNSKFCSCMTLFALASGDGNGLFGQALDRYCDGRRDGRTLALIEAGTASPKPA